MAVTECSFCYNTSLDIGAEQFHGSRTTVGVHICYGCVEVIARSRLESGIEPVRSRIFSDKQAAMLYAEGLRHRRTVRILADRQGQRLLRHVLSLWKRQREPHPTLRLDMVDGQQTVVLFVPGAPQQPDWLKLPGPKLWKIHVHYPAVPDITEVDLKALAMLATDPESKPEKQ